MALRATTVAVAIGVAAAGSCSSDEQNALSDPQNTAEQFNACVRSASSILSGLNHDKFNHDKFNECFTAAMGISAECSECYAVTGKYSANKCKSTCRHGWCNSDCLSCTSPTYQAEVFCTGFAPAAVQPCDSPAPSPGQTITMRTNNTDLCLDIGDSPYNGSVWLRQCNGGESQFWVFDERFKQIRPAADGSTGLRCLDVGEYRTKVKNGLELHLRLCDGSSLQHWFYDPDDSTVHLGPYPVDSYACLDYYGDESRASSEQPAHIWECTGGRNQQWSLDDQPLSRLSV